MQEQVASNTAVEGTNRFGSLRGLIALNLTLLMVLGAVTFASRQVEANAQARGRGEYTMVAGGAPGVDAAAVYIVDVANQELIAVAFNQQTKQLDGVGYRNLGADAMSLTRTRSRAGN